MQTKNLFCTASDGKLGGAGAENEAKWLVSVLKEFKTTEPKSQLQFCIAK